MIKFSVLRLRSCLALYCLLSLAFVLNLAWQASSGEAKSKPTYDSKMQLGQLLYFNGNIDAAINAFLYAAALKPGAWEPHLNLVNLYVQKGTPENIVKAVDECKAVVRLKNNHKEAYLILGNLLRTQASFEKDDEIKKQKLDEAEAALGKALELGAPEATSNNTLALIMLMKGDNNAALMHIERALEKQFKFSDAHLVKGVLLFKAGKREEALKELDIAIAQKEKNAEAHSTKGDIFFVMGKYAEAQKEYQKAIEEEPRYAQAWAGMGNIHSQAKDFELAKQAYLKAKEFNRLDKNIVYSLAVALEKLGKINESIGEFQDGLLLETDPMIAAQIRLHIQQLKSQNILNVDSLKHSSNSRLIPNEAQDNVNNRLFNNSTFSQGMLGQPFSSLLKIKPDSNLGKFRP